MGCFDCLAAPPGQGGDLCTAVTLVRRHPSLLSCTAICHIGTVLALLRHTSTASLENFLDIAPAKAASTAFAKAIRGMTRERLLAMLPSLLNNTQLHESMAKIFTALDAGCLIELLNHVSAEKLAILLKADPYKLEEVVRSVDGDSDCIKAVFIPVLQEPKELVEQTLVPLISNLHQPEYMGQLANHVPVRTLLWILRNVKVDKLVAILDEFGPEDLRPQGNTIKLLQQASENPDLVDQKVVPLLQQGTPEKIATVVRRVAPAKLLAILNRVEAADLVRLLEHTNAEVAIALLNGPLEAAVGYTSSFVADQLRDPMAAAAVERITDGLGTGMVWRMEAVRRGKTERGAEDQDTYKFGDFTRGVMADVSEKTQDAITKQKEAYADLSDKAKEAITRQQAAVAEMSDKAKDAIARHTEKAGAGIAEVQDAVRRGKEDALKQAMQFGTLTKGLVENISDKAKAVVNRGKERRGSDPEDSYQVGDLTRGLLTDQQDTENNSESI